MFWLLFLLVSLTFRRFFALSFWFHSFSNVFLLSPTLVSLVSAYFCCFSLPFCSFTCVFCHFSTCFAHYLAFLLLSPLLSSFASAFCCFLLWFRSFSSLLPRLKLWFAKTKKTFLFDLRAEGWVNIEKIAAFVPDATNSSRKWCRVGQNARDDTRNWSPSFY